MTDLLDRIFQSQPPGSCSLEIFPTSHGATLNLVNGVAWIAPLLNASDLQRVTVCILYDLNETNFLIVLLVFRELPACMRDKDILVKSPGRELQV